MSEFEELMAEIAGEERKPGIEKLFRDYGVQKKSDLKHLKEKDFPSGTFKLVEKRKLFPHWEEDREASGIHVKGDIVGHNKNEAEKITNVEIAGNQYGHLSTGANQSNTKETNVIKDADINNSNVKQEAKSSHSNKTFNFNDKVDHGNLGCDTVTQTFNQGKVVHGDSLKGENVVKCGTSSGTINMGTAPTAGKTTEDNR